MNDKQSSDASKTPPPEQIGPFQLVLLLLSFYVLVALVAEATITLSQDTKQILLIADTAICGLFIFDFFLRLWRAERKMAFLKWAWIDLVSSIPIFGLLRVGRLVRVVRVIRVLRGFRSAKVIFLTLFSHRATGAFATAVFACGMLVVFTSISVLHVENDPNSNIKGAADALWWSLVTVTTVGYGDKYPVTTEGRFLGGLLMTAGVGLFAVLTGYVASWFMEQPSRAHPSLEDEVRAVREEIIALRESVSLLRATAIASVQQKRDATSAAQDALGAIKTSGSRGEG